MFMSSTRKQQTLVGDEAAVDPREIDKVLSEVAGMVGRWNLFKKFLSEALRVIQFFRFLFGGID